ncbi:UDP-glucuronosyltransferase 2B13-like [Clupea harengus]|uniref:UDP-glucuronosyltransferase n=1 Tax=Clupea harengus TaxID=7950 RepID=A0A6P8FTA4_CLUHA|nr:UDP-glucuronosyltransferase 2B13-like [Clupea harengus]
MAPWLLPVLLSPVYFLSLLVISCPACHGGKILLVPIEGSHWVNMEILIGALHNQGHSITMVRSTKSWYIKADSPYYDSVTVSVDKGFNEEFVKPFLVQIMEIERGSRSFIDFIHFQLLFSLALYRLHDISCHMAASMFEDRALMRHLNESQFDLVLTDPSSAEGILLAHYLKLPLVHNARWLTSTEGHFSLAPSPVSYIPVTGSGLSDKMTFLQRVKNMLFYLLMQFQLRFLIHAQYQAICDKYFEHEVDYSQIVKAADLWLMRVDFVFEFPRPTMPNIVYIGGFQCKPAKPLPQDLEDFVQSSGDHGVILMSLGTLVSAISGDIAKDIAAAFAELPQKVIWRHVGERPSTLGNNTLLVKWMPQNDLLGHPKIRAFVAHGGTNGLQEAIYHGVPVVGIPVFFDQYDNLFRLKERGGAKVFSIAAINKNTFLQGLQEVLHEPSYRENMQRLSRLHRDQPMKPLDRALFWIEFVMRHKGAAHLRTESYKMPWYAYHSVDVVLFLLVVTLSFMYIVVYGIKVFCCRVCLRRKIKHE